ncbi:MAG TPA: ATP-binding protein, partial [Polyangiaceae bacterium]|nr:ATP-binding protein [Polyangiaceae bacterium]
VSASRNRKSGGTGVGLAITERAVRLHGGTVKAANATGGGLIVSIGLPLAAD